MLTTDTVVSIVYKLEVRLKVTLMFLFQHFIR